MAKSPKILENSCKTPCKSTRKTRVNFRVNLFNLQNHVYNLTFSPTSTHFPTILLTPFPPLYLINLFHYSTDSTITTINNLIERI